MCVIAVSLVFASFAQQHSTIITHPFVDASVLVLCPQEEQESVLRELDGGSLDNSGATRRLGWDHQSATRTSPMSSRQIGGASVNMVFIPSSRWCGRHRSRQESIPQGTSERYTYITIARSHLKLRHSSDSGCEIEREYNMKDANSSAIEDYQPVIAAARHMNSSELGRVPASARRCCSIEYPAWLCKTVPTAS